MTENLELVSLVLLSVALFISLCLNVIFCIRRKDNLCTDTDESCCTQIYTGESLSQDEGHYSHNLSHEGQQENPHNHHEQQENPIYGNISSDRRDSVEVCYETMTKQHRRDCMKSREPDLNYASLDLKMTKKRVKKNRYQQGQKKHQDELPVHLTPPVNSFLEVEVDVEAHLPSRDTSTMVSHSSIYLNSQQIAQETEEMEREREDWEGIRRREDGQSREWKGVQVERKASNGSVCTQLSEVEAIQSNIDHFISSFSHDTDQ